MHRAAVVAGAASGLVALLVDAPVTVACLRGGLAWAAAILVGRLARWMVTSMLAREPFPKEEPGEVEQDSTLKPSESVGR